MSVIHRSRLLTLFAVAVGFLFPAAGFSRGKDVTFRGAVTRIQQSDANHGSVSVQLEQVELPVVVNAETDIELSGDLAGLSGVAVGDFVKISGYYSTKGVVAKEIQILDDKGTDFRLRGRIGAATNNSAGMVVTIQGQSVQLDKNSRIERRGTDDNLSSSSVTAGMEVDVRGESRDGQLLARVVVVGDRQDDSARVRFEGVIQDVQDSRVLIDTEGGGLAVALITSSTTVKGTLQKGMQVEVKGSLNENLEVVAQVIKAEDAGDDKGNDTPGTDDKGNNTGNGNDDHGNDNPVQVAKAIALTATPAGAGGRGEAEIEFEKESDKVSQRITVEIEDVAPMADFHVLVTLSTSETIDLGSLLTDSKGSAKLRLTFSSSGAPLPAGKDVRDIASVQVTLNGNVVLQGGF